MLEAEADADGRVPEIAAGALIPLVLWGVWRTTRRIHEKIRAP